jgi:peptide/nickel transport system substrate-binding protein
MRTYYWYITAYLRKHGLVVVASLIAAVLIFSLAIPTVLRGLDRKPRRYIGVVGSYTLESLPPSITKKLSRGLTSIAKDGSAVPDLAERWTVENEGKTYRFILKKDQLWQDNELFRPSDVNYAFRDVEVITTPSEVVFKLPDSYVPFPTVVSQPILKNGKRQLGPLRTLEVPLGLGEYQVIDYQKNGQRLTQMILEGFDERLIYRFYLTEDDAVTAFKLGEVDYVPDLSSRYGLENWDGVVITNTLHSNRYLGIFFNNSSPLFPKHIRQALAYAFPKPDRSIRALGPIDPNSWAYLEGGKTYDLDLDRALERALESVPDQAMEFELTTTSTFQTEAEQLKQAWEEFGAKAVTACQGKKEVEDKTRCANLNIKVTVRVNNYPDTSSFQVLLIGQETASDPDQYYLWHSGQASNFTQYKNTRIDSLLEKGRTTLDQNERRSIYQEFQQFFLEDAPVIFLRYLESYDVSRN